jgi:glutamyl-tRNA synthetase
MGSGDIDVRRGRFAPTPSGQMHIGNALTALLAWLQMRHAGGQFVLRLEDTDKTRSRPALANGILEDLLWLGIDWDEGPDVGGPYKPYIQSDRYALYEDALDRLNREDWLYPCYCSRADIMSVASAPHGLFSEGPVYPGTCRRLAPEIRAAKQAAKSPSLRFSVQDRSIDFVDGAAGRQRYQADAGGDFVVKRADGMMSYQLAVVVDDASMGITDVLRGFDLLDSTPRQLLLYEALGLKPPRFSHTPLLCGSDGSRLSKRRKSITLAAMREAGTAPEKVVGILAYITELNERPEPLKATDLIAGFNLAKVPQERVAMSEELFGKLLGI